MDNLLRQIKKILRLIVFHSAISFFAWFFFFYINNYLIISLIFFVFPFAILSGITVPLFLYKTDKTKFFRKNLLNSTIFIIVFIFILFIVALPNNSQPNYQEIILFTLIFGSINFTSGIFMSNKIKYKPLLRICLITALLLISSNIINEIEFKNKGEFGWDFVFMSRFRDGFVSFGSNPYSDRENIKISNVTRIHYGWPFIYFYKQTYMANSIPKNIYLIDIPRSAINFLFYFTIIYIIEIIIFSNRKKIDLRIIKD